MSLCGVIALATVLGAAAGDGSAGVLTPNLTEPARRPLAIGPAADDGLGPNDCWLEPMDLSVTQLLASGSINSYVSKRYCLRRLSGSELRFHPGKRTIGRTHLGSLTLFDEQFGYGLQVMMAPGQNGAPDFIYTAPYLDLPDSWDRAIDTVTYPVVIIGGAAIFTTVLIQLFAK